MDVCHLLLSRPLQFNVDAVHRGRNNMYKSWWNSKKVHLVHFKNKKKNPKTKRKNFFAIVKGNLKEDCDSCKKL